MFSVLWLVVFLLSQQFCVIIVVQGLHYEEFPMIPCHADEDRIPEDVKIYFEIVGIVVHKSSLQSKNNLKHSSVEKHFTAGDFTPFTGEKLCDAQVSITPAVFTAGTGSIIGKNRFLTAYHVAENLLHNPMHKAATVKDLYIVFNFRQKTTADSLMKQNVYQVEEIVEENISEDWIILRTKKGFTHNSGVRFGLERDAVQLLPNEPVYVLGHPLGMPLHYAAGEVSEVDLNLDQGLHIVTSGFAGNSGSPIVRLSSGKIFGIFTSYDDKNSTNDFELDRFNNCYDFKLLTRTGNNSVMVNGPLSTKVCSNNPVNCMDEETRDTAHDEL